MEINELISTIIQICLIPLLSVLTGYLVAFIKKKSSVLQEEVENETAKKYLNLLSEVVCSCVTATNQTYVEALKENGNFTNEEAHKEAFNKTKEAVLAILSDKAKESLASAFGDLDKLIENKIEEAVNKK